MQYDLQNVKYPINNNTKFFSQFQVAHLFRMLSVIVSMFWVEFHFSNYFINIANLDGISAEENPIRFSEKLFLWMISILYARKFFI